MKQGSPRIGVVGVEDGWSSQKLREAVEERTGEGRLIELGRAVFDLAEGRVLFEGEDLSTYDALIVKKIGRNYRRELLDRLEMLVFLEQQGMRIFSRPVPIMRLLDRLSCTAALRAGGIPIPATVATEDVDAAVEAVERFGKSILKPLFSSKGRGMEVVEPGAEARNQIAAFREQGNAILYVQQMVPLPGSDLGVVFLGGDYIGSYARVSGGTSWKTTIHSGGKYQAHDPDQSIIDLAHRAQALFDLDFTCVDVAETPDGPVVFEVSAFGGFRGLLEARGVDAAGLYVDHVLRRLSNG